MKEIEINGTWVAVIEENISYMGRVWTQVEKYPVTHMFTCYDKWVREECEDWPVLEDDNMTLYMNNEQGFMVLIEREKTHFEDKTGIVTDKPGRILYSPI